MKRLLKRLRKFIQLILLNEIPLTYLWKVEFPHPIGIVIGDSVIIGSNVVIYQNVTIGRRGMEEEESYPVIGDGVMIYPGAVIYGNIEIGNNSVIGANATVSINIPPRSVVVGHNIVISKE